MPVQLRPPPEPGDTLRHDPTFERWDTEVCALRDVANLGIEALRGIGADVTPLPGGSLRELLVEPLSGDHGAIRQNAAACHVVRDALVELSHQQAGVALRAAARWEGDAGLAHVGAVGARAAATRALAELVAAAGPVLDEVADVCERLTVEVEGLVVECGERLGSLVRRLLARVSGPLGWGVLAWEVATEGLSAVTDLVDDVRRVVQIVETLLRLQDTVATWAREQRDLLETLLDLPDLLRAIS